MKTLLCLLTGLICFISFSAGQIPFEKRKIIKEKAPEECMLQHQLHLKNGINLSHHLAKNESLKSTALKWNWDTVYTYDTAGISNRLTRTFDQSGNVITELKESRENDEWVNYSKTDFTYDSAGYILTETNSEWFYTVWTIYEVRTCTYDSKGNLITELYESNWSNPWKTTYTYDDYGNLASVTDQEKQGYTWLNIDKTLIVCDQYGNCLSYLSLVWQNDAWVNDIRITFTYNDLGQWFEDIYEFWHNDAWVYTWKYVYTWDVNNDLSVELEMVWDSVSSWEYDSKSTYSYDENHNVLNNLLETWSEASWVKTRMTRYTYNSNGDRLSRLYQTWSGNEWVNDKQDSYSFDPNGNSLAGKNEKWISEAWKPGLGTLYVAVSHDLHAYYLFGKYRFEAHFVSFINGLESNTETETPGLSIYPNPSCSRITISTMELMTGNQLTILDLTGKMMLTLPISTRSTDVDVLCLPEGVYIVKIVKNRNIYTGKFVRE
jgi:hypothetical protein